MVYFQMGSFEVSKTCFLFISSAVLFFMFIKVGSPPRSFLYSSVSCWVARVSSLMSIMGLVMHSINGNSLEVMWLPATSLNGTMPSRR